jgi:hypothetical protein
MTFEAPPRDIVSKQPELAQMVYPSAMRVAIHAAPLMPRSGSHLESRVPEIMQNKVEVWLTTGIDRAVPEQFLIAPSLVNCGAINLLIDCHIRYAIEVPTVEALIAYLESNDRHSMNRPRPPGMLAVQTAAAAKAEAAAMPLEKEAHIVVRAGEDPAPSILRLIEHRDGHPSRAELLWVDSRPPIWKGLELWCEARMHADSGGRTYRALFASVISAA